MGSYSIVVITLVLRNIDFPSKIIAKLTSSVYLDERNMFLFMKRLQQVDYLNRETLHFLLSTTYPLETGILEEMHLSIYFV
jgi:hypothetical protein